MGGRSLTQSRTITVPASNTPYTYGPLVNDIYIGSDLTDTEPLPVILNMHNYARNNISNYNTITEIPNGHLPTDINTSTAQNWYDAFSNCKCLISLPEQFYDTSNATNIGYMFSNCKNLTTVPNFDTSNVTDMSYMFQSCSNIKGDLYIESNNVTDAGYMFYGCSNYVKNIYCHANSTTYNTIYANMGNRTYNSNWNAYLKTF